MSRTRITVLIVAFLLMGGGSGHAEIRPGAITFTPLVGGYLFEGNQNLRNEPLFGAALGYDVTKHFGAEAMFNYIGTKNKLLGRDVDAYVYHLDGLYYFCPDKKLVPYLAVGGGGLSLNPGARESDTNGMIDYGFGVKYSVTKNLALRGDIRHLITFGNHNNNLSYALGVTYQWGGAKPTPAPPTVSEVEKTVVPPAVVEKKVAPPQKEVCVYLDVYFDFDRAVIKPRYDNEIKKIADFMKAHPHLTATIKGYTDYVGTEEYNKLLSDRRAESVKDYLVDHFGISPERITTVGFGENRPRATNQTAFGRQLNRRASQISCTFEIAFH